MIKPFSHILVCSNIEKAYGHIQEECLEFRICQFFPEKGDFLLEDAKKVIKEAYIAEEKTKILILGAKSYRIEAQNSLLKILEEPPRNIVFILIAPAKTVFLPTIRSRLSLKELKIEKEMVSLELNLKNLCEKDIYEFVKTNARLEKAKLKDTIQTIVSRAILEHKISFTKQELSHFQTLLELAELNSRPQNILFSLLLTIMKRKRS